MSVYIVINESEPIFFSSNKGWSDILDWVGFLPLANGFEELIHLAEHGYLEGDDIDKFNLQAVNAISQYPPSESVAKTLNELLDLTRDEKGVILISNGLSEEDGDELSE
jgi:hypothetical protein